MEKRNNVLAAAYVLIKKEDGILLMRRYNTGYKDGSYTLPSGHVDEAELPLEAAIREAEEETGIVILKNDITCAHVMYRVPDDGQVYVDYYFIVERYSGEPHIAEPHKCDDMQWFKTDELPKNTLSGVALAIQHIQDRDNFSEINEMT